MYEIYKIFDIETCNRFTGFIRNTITYSIILLDTVYYRKRLLKWISYKEILQIILSLITIRNISWRNEIKDTRIYRQKTKRIWYYERVNKIRYKRWYYTRYNYCK